MGFQGHVEAHRPNTPGQRRAGRPGPCVPKLPLRTSDVPVKPGPRTGSMTPTPLLTLHERGLQDPLTREQYRPCRPHDATREGVDEHRLPRRNDSLPCAPLHYASKCDRAAPPDRGRAPLNGRAVLQAEATQGRTRGSTTDGGAGMDGPDMRRPPSDRPSGHATPTDQGRDGS